MNLLRHRAISYSLPIIWGGTFILIKLGERGFSPLSLSTLRFGIAGVAFAFLFATRAIRFKAVRREDLPAFCGLVATLLGGQLLLNMALAAMPASFTSVVVQGAPAMTLLLSVMIRGERISGRVLAGMGMAFSATTAVLLGSAQELPALESGNTFLLALSVPLSIALYNVLAKPLVERYGAANVAGQVVGLTGAALLSAAPFQPSLLRESADATVAEWAAVAGLAIVATLVAYLLWAALLERLKPAEVASLIYVVPIVSVLLSVTLLGEPLRLTLILGVLGVLAGLKLIEDGKRAQVARMRPYDGGSLR